MQKLIASSLSALMAFGAMPSSAFGSSAGGETLTPIKHVVVIFGENISFDHYFGTYPFAANPFGEPKFSAKHGSPSVNGLTDALLYNNPNVFNTGNGTGAMNPFRLDRTEAATNDQDHNYLPEQEALHMGLMDAFPEYTGTAGPPPPGAPTKGLVMGYYDGNTVTALWNYAQQYAMNDNSFDTNFGPSTPGAINLISGQTNNVTEQSGASADVVSDGGSGYTLIGDADPIGDVCTTSSAQVQFMGNNIGTMLSTAGISWGFFQGGFDLTQTNANGTSGCLRSTTSTITGTNKLDYIPHHQPFQYYTTTANPTHARPTSVATIGINGDAANHQYDTSDFYAAVKAGHMPAVSFLKAPGYQDAHAGYSDPLDEQAFVVDVIDFLMSTKEWESTAVIINYDDSDGWYDHQMPTIVNQSTTASDAISGPGMCGTTGLTSALSGPSGTAHAQGRCGYGPRMPYLVISPYAKENYVSHMMTDQTSTIRFIEDNWLGGERVGDGSFDILAGTINDMFDFSHPQSTKLVLNPTTGEPKK